MSLKARGDYLRSTSRVLATLWEMPKDYWRPLQQPLPSSGYTLGNAQIEAETRWAHFPACLQPIGSKDTPSAYCPCVSADIRHSNHITFAKTQTGATVPLSHDVKKMVKLLKH